MIDIQIGRLYKMLMDEGRYSIVVVTDVSPSTQWNTSVHVFELKHPEDPFVVPFYVASGLWKPLEKDDQSVQIYNY